jgi:hypothetical protein
MTGSAEEPRHSTDAMHLLHTLVEGALSLSNSERLLSSAGPVPQVPEALTSALRDTLMARAASEGYALVDAVVDLAVEEDADTRIWPHQVPPSDLVDRVLDSISSATVRHRTENDQVIHASDDVVVIDVPGVSSRDAATAGVHDRDENEWR